MKQTYNPSSKTSASLEHQDNNFDTKKLPLFTVNGNNEEIGKQIGSLLKDRIYSTLDFYKGVFRKEEEKIFTYAKMFQNSIKSFNNDYAIEINSMAETIDVDPLWIYALNARSEIMNKFANECTASYFKNSRLLGQNWDWAKELEDLAVILRIKQPNKPDILQMTEPGIIGKIGFNSEGLGVCLNFLHIDGYDPKGVPTHILLRAVLDCNTIDEAHQVVKDHATGRTSNFLIGDQYGNYLDVEFAGDEQFILDSNKDLFLHTNHYIDKQLNPETDEFASSYSRFKRGSEILTDYNQPNVSDFKSLLLDKKNESLPICRKYTKPINDLLETTGTICSLVMDLENKSMHITRGSPLHHPFEEITLN